MWRARAAGTRRRLRRETPTPCTTLGGLLAGLDPPDMEGARGWFQQAAEAGNADAMVTLSPVLAVEGDLKGSRVLLQRAGDAGMPGAGDYASALDDDRAVRDAAYVKLKGLDDDTNAWNFLGVAALRVGARDEARASWMKSRDAGDGAAPLLLSTPAALAFDAAARSSMCARSRSGWEPQA